MTPASFEQFTEAARARGCDETLLREWAPHQEVAEHTHPFDTDAVVARGEFWLTLGGQTRHFKQGDAFQVPRNVPHSEKYVSDHLTASLASRWVMGQGVAGGRSSTTDSERESRFRITGSADDQSFCTTFRGGTP
jgi:hypothetical protein